MRHIERNSILIFLISCESKNVIKDYKLLISELKNYNNELLDKERIIVISKSDLSSNLVLNAIQNKINSNLIGIESHFISSANNNGIKELKDIIWKKLNIN